MSYERAVLLVGRPPPLTRLQTCIVSLAIVVGIVVLKPAQGPSSHLEAAAAGPRFRAVALDYFVVFNPDSVVPEVERIFPGMGRELTNLWRARQFEYSWLRSITNRYVDFFEVTEQYRSYVVFFKVQYQCLKSVFKHQQFTSLGFG